ncbi:pentatricopeptide repeat-containing protein At4g38010-like [Wolffia australiana]
MNWRFADVKSKFLKFLRRSRSAKELKQIHAKLLISGLLIDRLIIAELIQSILVSTHQEKYACQVLKQVPHRFRSPFLLNLLVSAPGIDRNLGLIFSVYKRAIGCGFFPDRYTFPGLLKNCAKNSAAYEIDLIHGIVIKLAFSGDIFVQNAIIHAYGSTGQPINAKKLFDEMPVRDVVSWTGLISGYVKGGFLQEAVSTFKAMDEVPNEATLVSVLVAFGRLRLVEEGRRIHGLMIKLRWDNLLILGNALLDLYVKSEKFDVARQLFHELPQRDVVSWTSIISGFVQVNQPKEALEMFTVMKSSGVEPDKLTLASLLSACASLGDLETGKCVHEYIDRRVIPWDVHLYTAMVDMYAKCGCIEMALRLFEQMPKRNVKSWNALLCGLAMHGFARRVIEFYDRMNCSGVSPNEVTFVALLSACSHAGLVQEGKFFFSAMTEVYGLAPKIEHYGCIVDLLCRAELIQEAFSLVQTMPMEADALIWCSLLGACRLVDDDQMTEKILAFIEESKPSEGGVCVLLSNLYASACRWRDASKVRQWMAERGIRKEAGSSIIAVNGMVEEFVAGVNCQYLEINEIRRVLTLLHCHQAS